MSEPVSLDRWWEHPYGYRAWRIADENGEYDGLFVGCLSCHIHAVMGWAHFEDTGHVFPVVTTGCEECECEFEGGDAVSVRIRGGVASASEAVPAGQMMKHLLPSGVAVHLGPPITSQETAAA